MEVKMKEIKGNTRFTGVSDIRSHRLYFLKASKNYQKRK